MMAVINYQVLGWVTIAICLLLKPKQPTFAITNIQPFTTDLFAPRFSHFILFLERSEHGDQVTRAKMVSHQPINVRNSDHGKVCLGDAHVRLAYVTLRIYTCVIKNMLLYTCGTG